MCPKLKSLKVDGPDLDLLELVSKANFASRIKALDIRIRTFSQFNGLMDAWISFPSLEELRFSIRLSSSGWRGYQGLVGNFFKLICSHPTLRNLYLDEISAKEFKILVDGIVECGLPVSLEEYPQLNVAYPHR